MDLQQRLEQLAAAYLRGEMDSAGFERAFLPLLPAAVSPPSPDHLQAIAMKIDALLVEMDLGDATEQDLRTWLASSLQDPVRAFSADLLRRLPPHKAGILDPSHPLPPGARIVTRSGVTVERAARAA